MSEYGGGEGDRPRWEGFPGGVEPDQYSDGPGTQGYEPVPPQFPVDPGPDVTAPMPVVAAAAADESAPPGPRSARHGHAAPRPSTSRYIAIACAVAIAVIVAGFLFVSCTGSDGTASSDPNVVPFVSSTPTPTPTPSPTQSVPTASPTSSPSASTTRSASPSPSASATSSASPSPSATATVAAVKQPVVVLNGTNITGLAKRAAATVTAGGWTVTKTTNWTGQPVTSTTIYYLPGAKNKASAKLFAKQFDVVTAVKPALPGMTSNLTLVLARDAA